MPKLTKQQILILSVMAIVICYGAYDFFIASRAKNAPVDMAAKSSDLGAFVSDITAGITGNQLSAVDAYIVSRAETQWKNNPFYLNKYFRDWVTLKGKAEADSGPGSEAKFSYSGYLEMNRKKIAIINGIEYAAGEPLEIEGYVLKEIYPDKVMILNERREAEFAILLQE
ncbi:MAG: hypothetical protein WC560_00440 [Syntrophales bacterium]